MTRSCRVRRCSGACRSSRRAHRGRDRPAARFGARSDTGRAVGGAAARPAADRAPPQPPTGCAALPRAEPGPSRPQCSPPGARHRACRAPPELCRRHACLVGRHPSSTHTRRGAASLDAMAAAPAARRPASRRPPPAQGLKDIAPGRRFFRRGHADVAQTRVPDRTAIGDRAPGKKPPAGARGHGPSPRRRGDP